MSRVNVDYHEKQSVSDIFTLTNVVTNESVALIPSDSEGNFDWRGITKAPLTRNAMQTTQSSGEWSDMEYPWMAIQQEDWTGGRANLRFSTDKSRFMDSKRAQSAFNACIFNAPLDYYATGIRKAMTNHPGSLSWKNVTGASEHIAIGVSASSTVSVGEVYIHLRKRGTPEEGLLVELADGLTSDGNVIASHEYTAEEITDTLAEFAKFTFDSVSLVGGRTYYIRVSSQGGTSDDYWQVGTNTVSQLSTYESSDGDAWETANYELYYRIAEPQTDKHCKFFMYEQLEFMVRQNAQNTPSLWLNGEIGKATGTAESTLTDSAKMWSINQWKDARIGLVYRKGSEGHVSVWRKIVSNTVTEITVDEPWDIVPDTDVTYIIVDTPIWQEITGHGLTAYVTDIHVIRGVVYFAQGDYVNARKMRWHDGAFEWMELNFQASFLYSVRDKNGLMLYRARNDDDNHKRSVERSVLLDWETQYDAFSESVDYIIGQVVTYSDKLYRFKADHAAGAWAAGDVDEVTITPDDPEIPAYDANGKYVANRTSAVTTSGGKVYTPYVDFGSSDYDMREYAIRINTFSSTENKGSIVITLQESEDGLAFHDVQSVTANSKGTWYIFAHCDYRFRRFSLNASGTDCSVNNIRIMTTNFPHWEDRNTLLDNYGKITRLFEYGSEQEKSLWIFQEGMVSSINKTENTEDTYHLDRINIDELVTTSDEWNGKASNTSDVYLLWAWLNGLQRYYNTQLEGKGPDHDEGMPSDMQGMITQILPYPSNFFVSIDGGENGYSSVMMFNGSGWHNLYKAPNKGERIYDIAFQPIYGERPDRLWMQVGDDIVWLAMPSKILYALHDPNAEYTHESVMVSSWITGGMAEVDKLWQSLSIMADYLDGVTCWVEADYQLDDEETWHPIPENPYDTSPQQEENFAADDESINGKKLRYRLRLQTTDMHKTPKVNVVLIKAVGRVDIKYSYSFSFRNIKYKADLTGEYEELEPYELDNILHEWANKLATLRLRSAYKIFDNKRVFLDAVQTSVVHEKNEGYLGNITLTEI